MKKSTICIFVAAFCGAAQADWTLVTEFKETPGRFYIDIETIRTVGSYIRAWTLTDYDSEFTPKGGSAYKSSRILKEFDCPNDQSRTLAVSQSSGNMGDGFVVYSDMDISKPTGWQALAPGTNGKSWQDIVCNLRSLTGKPKAWTSIGEQEGVSLSIDKGSLQRSGTVVQARTLYDLKTAQTSARMPAVQHFSRVLTVDFDCQDYSYRVPSIVYYSRRLGEGRIIEISAITMTSGDSFSAIEPGSLAERQLKAVCVGKP